MFGGPSCDFQFIRLLVVQVCSGQRKRPVHQLSPGSTGFCAAESSAGDAGNLMRVYWVHSRGWYDRRCGHAARIASLQAMQLVMEYQQKRFKTETLTLKSETQACVHRPRSQEEMLAKQQQLQREHIEDTVGLSMQRSLVRLSDSQLRLNCA